MVIGHIIPIVTQILEFLKTKLEESGFSVVIAPASSTTVNTDLAIIINNVDVVSSKNESYLCNADIMIIPQFYQYYEALFWEKIDTLITTVVQLGRSSKPEFITTIAFTGFQQLRDNEGYFYTLGLRISFILRR